MTNEQILKKAFIKAISNGWKGVRMRVYPTLPPNTIWGGSGIWLSELLTEKEYKKYKNKDWNFPGRLNEPWRPDEYYHIIFSHDFARAFWGKEHTKIGCGQENWQIRLEEMVLKEQPLKYLEKFI